MTWLRFALLAVDRTVGGIIFLLQKMEPPIRNKPPIRNTFAADRVIFRIGVFTVLPINFIKVGVPSKLPGTGQCRQLG